MNRSILIVEDDPLDRKFIAQALLSADKDVVVEVANDGQEALDRLQNKTKPALILFDLKMPRMDGKTFLTHLKTDEQTRAIPAIVLSTSKDPDDVLACYASSANAYLVKPSRRIDYQTLAERLTNFWLAEAQLPAVEAD